MNRKRSNRFSALLVMALMTFISTTVVADRLDEMISPISNPVNFEDPRANTEARLIYLYHSIDDDFITQGGNAQLIALQLRYAVNDRLAIIATKDGFIDFNPDAVLTDETGWANIGLGAKYAFYKDDEAGEIVTAGLRYELPFGNTDVFQGYGDGAINPFLSAAKAFGDINVMAGTGLRLAIDNSDSSFWDLDLHIDTEVNGFYPTLEFNMIQVIDDGNRLPIADEGLDLFNFGASNAAGKTIVTAGAGVRYRLCNDIDLGVVYQIPLTDGAGSNLIDWRVTSDVIFSFDL